MNQWHQRPGATKLNISTKFGTVSVVTQKSVTLMSIYALNNTLTPKCCKLPVGKPGRLLRRSPILIGPLCCRSKKPGCKVYVWRFQNYNHQGRCQEMLLL